MRIMRSTPPGTPTADTTTNRAGRRLLKGALGTTAVAVLAVGMAGPAAAQTTPPQGVDGNVEVSSSIALTGLTSAFTLAGLANSTVTENGEVVFNVETNNLAGYAVTVQAAAATLVADTAGNTDSIPIGELSVRETGTTPFTPLSNLTPVTVHSQDERSAPGGDSLSNDYSVDIPFVNEDNYDVTINYVAAAL